MPCHIRKNDIVEVITGDHKGDRGKVLRVDVEKSKVLVEGINLIYRHVKPTRKNPQGGRVRREAAFHISNVLPVDTKKGRGSRVRMDINKDSHGHTLSKQRVSVGGTVLGDVTHADPAKRQGKV